MVDHLAEKLVSAAIASGAVKKSDREVYLFGYQTLIEKALSWVSILVLSAFFHKFTSALFFALFFIPLRSNAGGYHARTVLPCYLISVISFAAFCFVEPIMSDNVSNVVCYLLLAIGTTVILILAPIADENKPITVSEAKQYKKRTIKILTVEVIIIIICINLPFARTVSFFLLYAVFMVSILLLIAWRKMLIDSQSIKTTTASEGRGID